MFNDVQISEDGPINGYVVIFDMKGVKLGHMAKVQFGPLRTFMNYIQVYVTQNVCNFDYIFLFLFRKRILYV